MLFLEESWGNCPTGSQDATDRRPLRRVMGDHVICEYRCTMCQPQLFLNPFEYPVVYRHSIKSSAGDPFDADYESFLTSRYAPVQKSDWKILVDANKAADNIGDAILKAISGKTIPIEIEDPLYVDCHRAHK